MRFVKVTTLIGFIISAIVAAETLTVATPLEYVKIIGIPTIICFGISLAISLIGGLLIMKFTNAEEDANVGENYGTVIPILLEDYEQPVYFVATNTRYGNILTTHDGVNYKHRKVPLKYVEVTNIPEQLDTRMATTVCFEFKNRILNTFFIYPKHDEIWIYVKDDKDAVYASYEFLDQE